MQVFIIGSPLDTTEEVPNEDTSREYKTIYKLQILEKIF